MNSGIPLESLIGGNKAVSLEPESQDKILGIAAIKKYFSGPKAAIF